ncbi:putative conjugative transfer protein TraW [Legionella quinlivanii]|uniref:Putative conjugative transfer protein TraW n=1 Tax=Legionella quinlivanii TaxID=45073 RepID=A0A0W0XSL2_9GAMM|nr:MULTISPECIES: type-F conjugative transfer system protein TraW [Legionella]KTD47446.1 putative conjugative transfer protein TraW [Legionella quinlivanii]MCE3043689.1 type-F conjugative transfer system protein TraW [Legionella sp. 16cNR16C]SEG46514.1 conjugal transfer pilus assembly protein TraW [Legionella quinlivanii DSM 21216]STY49833.1 putative conjugative transfer protein TraW [Legionella quinlivanii]
MKKRAGFALSLFISVVSVHAQNLGNYGEVFPIIEEDIREVIMNKLHRMERSGELKEHQEQLISRVEAHVRRPNPLHLSTTKSPRVYEIDPSINVNQTLYTPDGVLIAKAGTRLNPFERTSFSKTLLFFNADDPKQMAWVHTHYKQYDFVKFILTGGDVRETSNLLGSIYFDLEGRLSSYFHLQHVPSIVRQKGVVWSIQEISCE